MSPFSIKNVSAFVRHSYCHGLDVACKKALEVITSSQNQKKAKAKVQLKDLRSTSESNRNGFVMIITNSEIEQCLMYRVEQKIEILGELGFETIICKSYEEGRIFSYLPLVSHVIVYRTIIPVDTIDLLKKSGAKLYFEVDDLIVTSKNNSIIDNKYIDSNTAISIENEMRDLTITMTYFDDVIVSTKILGKKLSKKLTRGQKIHKIPNFPLKNIDYENTKSIYSNKIFDICFTSPSVSNDIERLIKILEQNISNLNKKTSLMLIGNKLAYDVITKKFPDLYIEYQEYISYKKYIQNISKAKFVIIPLENTEFNQCKTVVRLLDACIARTLPVYDDVGEYQDISSGIKIEDGQWQNFFVNYGLVSSKYGEYLSKFVEEIEEKYGKKSSIKQYSRVFES